MLGDYDLTNNGKCTGCGACCSSILPMSKKEISKIRGYIKKHNIKVSATIGDIDCPFMDKEKKQNAARFIRLGREYAGRSNAILKSRKDSVRSMGFITSIRFSEGRNEFCKKAGAVFSQSRRKGDAERTAV